MVQIAPSSSYIVGTGGVGTINSDEVGPPAAPGSAIPPAADCICDPGISPSGIRYSNGTIVLRSVDLQSDANGTPFGITRDWTNGQGYAQGNFFGTGTLIADQPSLIQVNSNKIALLADGQTAYQFTRASSSSPWVGEAFLQNTLTYDTGTDEYVFSDPSGAEYRFFDFDTALPNHQQGELKTYTDPGGNTITNHYDATKRLAETTREFTAAGDEITESLGYAYATSGESIGAVASVTLKRQVGSGTPEQVRKVEYTYYDDGDAGGNVRNTKTVAIRNKNNNLVDTMYYRYYTSGNYVGGVKYFFDADSYARLVAANPSTALDSISDTTAAPYASNYFEYDSGHRVTKNVVQGTGTSEGTQGNRTSHVMKWNQLRLACTRQKYRKGAFFRQS